MSALPQPPYEPQQTSQPPQPPVHRARWKRVLAWIAAGIGILLLLIVVGIVVLLHSTKFHDYVLRVAQEKATATLGSPLQLQNYALHWSGMTPRMDLYGVVVHGGAPYQNTRVLQVDHIGAAVTITSLLHQTFYVQDVTVDHPVVQMIVDKNGANNLPKPKSSGQKSNTSIFDLGVRHALLDRGEVYYNDQKSVLDADLHDVTVQSAFDPGQTKYSGSLSYRDGHLRMQNFNPIPHDLTATFSLTPQQAILQKAVLSSGASQFVLSATVQDYSGNTPKANGNYQAVLDAGEFRKILKNPNVPVGVIRAAGTLQYVAEPNKPALNSVVVNGDIGSSVLRVDMPNMRTDIRDFGARYSLANGNADVRDIKAQLLGGELTGTLTMRDISGNSRSHLQAAVHGISLADAKALMNSPETKQVALGGAVNATADATWGKTMDDLLAKADATLKAKVAPSQQPANAVPVDGVIHARYSAKTKIVSLNQSYVRTPQTSLTMNGTVSDRSKLDVRMQANDLHEIETIATLFQTPTPSKPVQPLGLYGTASFVGAVTGATNAPHVTGQFQAANLRVKGSAWKVLRTNVDVSPSAASLRDGLLQSATRGQVTFNVATNLHKFSFTENSPFQAAINAQNLNVAELAKAAGSQAAVAGNLSANLAVHGTQLNPIGQGNVSLTNAKVNVEPIQSVNIDFNGTGDEVHATLVAKVPAGTANGKVTFYPKRDAYDAQLNATDFHLDRLETVKQRNMQLTGVLNLIASGRGTTKNPGLEASLQIPQLDVKGQRISGINLKAGVENHVGTFTLASDVINTQINGHGTVNLTGDYNADIKLDTQPIPFAPLVAIYAPAQAGNITGQTELHATVHGPLKDKNALQAHLVIPVLSADYKNVVQIAAASPIHADFENGVLQLQRATIRGTGTDLQFQGTIPTDSAKPVSLLLLGSVDLRLAQLFDPDITSSGQVKFDINSYGARANPDVQGQVQIVNANFASGDIPVGLQNGNGVLTLTKDRLNISSFKGTVGGGTLTASGGVVYRPSVQFHLAMAGQGVRVLLQEQGIRTGVDANISLAGTPDASFLTGQVRVEQLSFTPDFDLMNLASSAGSDTTPPPSQGLTSNMQLNIGIQSTTGINLVSRQLSVQGAANLRVTGTAAQPVILGRINLDGGDLIFNGNRYTLSGGTIDFANPTRTLPVLNVGVNTTIQQYDIHMQFWGPADQLHTSYTSDPALAPADIINLIARGQTLEAASQQPTTPGNLGAEQLIASQVSSQVTSRISKIAGISQLSIDPVLSGSGSGGNQNPGARITIQQRVTSKVFVTFSTDVTETQNDIIQLEYQITPKVSFSGTRDQNGGFGFDTKIKKSW